MNKELFELDKLFKLNKFEEVVSKTQKLIKSGNIIPPFYNLRGVSLENIGQNDKAIKNFQEAIQKDPNEISYYSNLARILIKQNELEKAEDILSKALIIKPDDTYSLFEYGKIRKIQKKQLKALEYFEKVYKINPNFPNSLFQIAKTNLEISQDTEDLKYKKTAKEKLLKCSKLFPENVDADFLLSEIFNYTNEKKHQQLMLNKVSNLNFSSNRQKSVLLFSIAKSYEDQKKYDQASEFLNLANREMNKNIEKNLIFKYSKRFENLKLLFDKIINIKSYKNENLYDRKIICIVGMPRSGTTLLHQLIAASNDVEGIGESSVIPSFFEDNIFSKDFFSNINKDDKFNKNYLLKISNFLGNKFDKIKLTDKKIIVDKNPSNFFWIGFIKLIFPNAKIIHIKRNLKDVCLSVYKNIFGVDEMNWSYNQKNIIDYVKIYLKIMDYWKFKYTDYIYEINYENLINNRSDETKKLFSFCSLDWSEDIFNYYKTGKTIRTASLYQVKKPMYKSSLNVSKNYTNYLTFLNEIDRLKIN
tara:strand:+ start:1820 stop:3409 length:1590 start_codon:yes stop_codon:yes gene_type:complete